MKKIMKRKFISVILVYVGHIRIVKMKLNNLEKKHNLGEPLKGGGVKLRYVGSKNFFA